MPNPLPLLTLPAHHRLRSGTAARLAGLPVTTLRVWERRYGVVAAAKTASGQRVYSPHDVSRLRLLRQLTAAGHAIGSIATLELESLQALAAGMPAAATAAAIGA
ncbi:MAG: MerR family transcriptional regulator, partial [Chitinophagaceae bacterium]|nr:MerR family transcriptional regulator [Rubrivivax sp.]